MTPPPSRILRGVNRCCPRCASDAPEPVAAIDAGRVVRANTTYRPDALELLGIDAAAMYRIVRCTRCGQLYTAELPSPELLQRLYTNVIDGERAAQISRAPLWIGHQLELAAALLMRLGSD